MGDNSSFVFSTSFSTLISTLDGYKHLFKMSENLILLQTPVQNPEVENTSILNFRKNPAPQPHKPPFIFVRPNRDFFVIMFRKK